MSYVIKVCVYILIFYNLLSYSTAQPIATSIKGPCGPLKKTISEEDVCYMGSELVTCPNISEPLAVIERRCRPPYNSNRHKMVMYICTGYTKWAPSYDVCQPDCGLSTEANKYPWIASIYDTEEKLICSGTIISPYHIVTGAQCFPLDPHETDYGRYTIIAGKHYSNIHRRRKSHQNRKIRNIIKHEAHKTWSPAREHDILLIEIDSEFEFLDDIRPACIDWESFYDERYLKGSSDGIVVGWKYNKDEVASSEVSIVRFWEKNICWENLSENFQQKYFGDDKFCAEHINDKSMRDINIGASLFFKTNEGRYFLRGIASVFNPDSKHYVLYTKISMYLEWLKLNMKKNKRILPFFETYGVKKDNNTGACMLPYQVQYGRFSLIAGNAYPENTRVPSETVILLSCEANAASTLSFRCLDKEWYPVIKTDICKRPGSCPSPRIDAESEKIRCTLENKEVGCNQPPINTTATVTCKNLYSRSENSNEHHCLNGDWEPPIANCTPECGIKRINANALAIGAVPTMKKEYPWVVAIYHNDNHICGGTLINRQYVLSAAHCFANKAEEKPNFDEYMIVAGKYFRNLDKEDEGSQKRKINNITIHDDYGGSTGNYLNDIALVELNEKITISEAVLPICIDWDHNYEDIDLAPDHVGVVAGWGYTKSNEHPSTVLKKLNVTFLSKDLCIKEFSEDFSQQFIKQDKICGKYDTKDSTLCNGDSGGGLYFKSDGTRYYIRGIVSLTKTNKDGCETNKYTLFAKVSKYLPWIKMHVDKLLYS